MLIYCRHKSLLHGCRIWTLKQRDINRLKREEMKFKGHTDNRRNEDILKEIKVDTVEKKLG
jgi:hypothetical protein